MAAKIFEVGVVLPATTQLRITSNDDPIPIHMVGGTGQIKTDNDNFVFSDYNVDFIENNRFMIDGYNYFNFWGSEPFVIVDTSSWSLSKRTVSTVSGIFTYESTYLLWEDLNAPSGYTITFNSNGGTTQTDLTGQTNLPNPLPTTTKSGYTFVAWYYESNFQTRAKAGDTIEANTTLYAKWHNLGTLFTGIANAIRSKDGTSGNIRDLDFDDRIRAIEPAKEEETKTVTPNFSSGNVDVTPTSGKVLSQVTINKDGNLIAENIKKDVTVHGITGTLESGGGGLQAGYVYLNSDSYYYGTYTLGGITIPEGASPITDYGTGSKTLFVDCGSADTYKIYVASVHIASGSVTVIGSVTTQTFSTTIYLAGYSANYAYLITTDVTF